MNLWKRTFSFLMALFMILSMLPVSALAEDGELEHEHVVLEEAVEVEAPIIEEVFTEIEAEVTETAEEAEEVIEETEAAEEAEEVTEETEAAEEAEEVTEEPTEEEVLEEPEEVTPETAEPSVLSHEHFYVWFPDAETTADSHQLTCYDCGDRSFWEKHTPGRNGYCDICLNYDHAHNPVFDAKSDWNASGHQIRCAGCDQILWEDHSLVNGACSVCGYVETCEHEFIFMYVDQECHQITCSKCDYSETAAHGNFTTDTWHLCGICGSHIHDFATMYHSDHELHDLYCSGCNTWAKENHIVGADNVCVVCAFEVHEPEYQYTPDIFEVPTYESHKVRCSVCSLSAILPHSFGADDLCTVCGYKNHTHEIIWHEGNWTDHRRHQLTCTGCDSIEWTNHTYVNGYCSVCGFRQHQENYVYMEGNKVDNYYHEVTCECGDTVERSHEWMGDSCCICGFVPHDHVYDKLDGINYCKHQLVCSICDEPGGWQSHEFADSICTVCGQAEENQHNLTWEDNFDYTESGHYPKCTVCGVGFYRAHTFDSDGVCTVCGYENHTHNYIYDGLPAGNSTCHGLTCTICGLGSTQRHDYVDHVCTICGFEEHYPHNYEYNLDSFGEEGHWAWCTECDFYGYAPHEYGEDDTCIICGFVFHEHKFAYVEGNGLTPWNHNLTCTGCGEVANIWEDHTLDENGSCTICTYRNHPHDFAWNESLPRSETGHSVFCAGCGATSSFSHHLADNHICTECGYAIERSVHEYEYDPRLPAETNGHYLHCNICGRDTDFCEPHTYVDGVCSACGAMDHAHPFVWVEGAYSEYDGHRLVCAECGVQNHFQHIFENGVCNVCSYEEHVVHRFAWFENNDFYPEYHILTCSVCGIGQAEDHVFDADGVCVICGFMKHEHDNEPIENTLANSHLMQCKICNLTSWEKHIFSDSHVCIVCGYQEHYPHDFTVIEDAISPFDHVLVCTVCNCIEQLAHEFNEDGLCTVCGYEGCQHAFLDGYDFAKFHEGHAGSCVNCHSYVTVPHVPGADGRCSVCGFRIHEPNYALSTDDPYNENAHHVFCQDCALGSIDRNNWLEHTFNDAKVCTVCGYTYHKHDYQLAAADSLRGTYNSYQHFFICSICDMWKGDEHKLNDQNVCTECGYSKHECVYAIDTALNCDSYHFERCIICDAKILITHDPYVDTCACGHVHNFVFSEESNFGDIMTCSTCGGTVSMPHTPGEDGTCIFCGIAFCEVHEYEVLYIGANDHYIQCTVCGYNTVQPHEYGADGFCFCGMEKHVHIQAEGDPCDDSYHYGTCTICGCRLFDEHIFEDFKCVTCGYEVEPHEHKMGQCYPAVNIDLEHKHVTRCEICGFAVLGLHNPVSDDVKPTATSAGVTNRVICKDCHWIVSEGQYLPKLVAPDAPTVSAVSNTTTGVKVTWSEVENAAKYRVYYKTSDGSWTSAGYSTGTSMTVTGLTSGTKYYFAVRTYNEEGLYSDRSSSKSITFIAAPSVSDVANTTTGVRVTWGSVKGAVNYRVMYKTSGGSWKTAGATTGTSMTVTGLISGTKYYFTVRCVNKDNTSTTSAYNTTGKSITYIAAPSVSDVANTTTGVKVTWGSVKGAVNYRVMYKTSGGSWKTAGTTTGTSLTVKDLTSGTKYYFTVRCVNKDNTSTTSAYNTTGKSITYIAAPSVSAVANTTTGVKVTWGSVKGAVNYRVMYKTSGGSWKSAGATTGTSFTVKGLKSGTKYYFTVVCVNKDNSKTTSAYNTTGKSITYIAAPALPTVSNTKSGVKVTWTAVSGAAKYRVYYKTSGGTWKKAGDTTSTSYTVKGLKAGTKYYFTVACVSKDGTKLTSAYNTTGKALTAK